MKSGLRSLNRAFRVSTFLQKLGWAALVCGVYMFISADSVSCHFSLSARALPSTSSIIDISLGLMRRLLSMKATPADAQGVLGSGDVMMVRRLP